MTAPFKAACIQLSAGPDPGPNAEIAAARIDEAAAAGARLVLTPENTNMIDPVFDRRYAKATAEADDPTLAALRDAAKRNGVWLLIGSLGVRSAAPDGAGKLANRSFLIDDGGEIVARYDKIHMFDVNLRNGEVYRESDDCLPGNRSVIADTPWGRLGLSVCYDLRFPHLYRALAKAGARFLAIPSAFTRTTGRAHWHVLVRARAIESGCYVFAPAQCGEHAEGRQTYGHSLIVDPWGAVLADAGDAPGIIFADVDPADSDQARHRIPSLSHDRPFISPDA